MRRDWDYVTIEDYQRDMDEQSKMAQAVIEGLLRDKEEMLGTIWALVAASGGRIEVTRQQLMIPPSERSFQTYRNDFNDSVVFEIPTMKYIATDLGDVADPEETADAYTVICHDDDEFLREE